MRTAWVASHCAARFIGRYDVDAHTPNLSKKRGHAAELESRFSRVSILDILASMWHLGGA